MNPSPPCPKCHSEYAYEDGALCACPDCGHEWASAEEAPATEPEGVVKDAHGNVLQDGDSVTLIKGLKVKGSPVDIKVGTRSKISV